MSSLFVGRGQKVTSGCWRVCCIAKSKPAASFWSLADGHWLSASPVKWVSNVRHTNADRKSWAQRLLPVVSLFSSAVFENARHLLPNKVRNLLSGDSCAKSDNLPLHLFGRLPGFAICWYASLQGIAVGLLIADSCIWFKTISDL